MKKIFLILLLSVFVSGCVSSSKKYKGVDQIDDKKALVYFYRESFRQGFIMFWDVLVNDKPIVKLTSGGYYPYLADPGLLVIGLDAYESNSKKGHFKLNIMEVQTVGLSDTATHSINVEAGKTYFITFSTVRGDVDLVKETSTTRTYSVPLDKHYSRPCWWKAVIEPVPEAIGRTDMKGCELLTGY